MSPPETFPERLAQARRRLAYRRWEDINDSRLAELVGTTTATVSRWMAGQMPSRSWLAKLADLLGVSAQYLEYGGEELGEPPLTFDPEIHVPHSAFLTPEEVDAREAAAAREKKSAGARRPRR